MKDKKKNAIGTTDNNGSAKLQILELSCQTRALKATYLFWSWKTERKDDAF